MSFILDALKKSENERARQNGPALLEARVVPPRRGVPVWAVIVSVILIANLALLAWVVLRTPPAAPPAAVATAQPVAAPPATAAPAPVPPPAAPVAAPPTVAPPAAVQAPPMQVPQMQAPQMLAPPSMAPASPPPAAAVVNPADYAPARAAEALPRPASRPSPGVAPALDPTLPTASDLTASGAGLPPMRLALHAYDADPANRYVLINSQRLREGETTNDGARVELIAPEGVLMSWRGQRFRLTPGE